MASRWPTTTMTTTNSNLSVPCNLPATSSPPTIFKTPRKPSKTWGKPYPTPTPLPFPVESDWLDEDRDGDKQREQERLEKIVKEQQRKIAEAWNNKKMEEETAPLCKLCKTIDNPCPFNIKPVSPTLTLEAEDWDSEKENGYRWKEHQWKEEDKIVKDSYYPPSPAYEPDFKQDPITPHTTVEQKRALDPDYFPKNISPVVNKCHQPLLTICSNP